VCRESRSVSRSSLRTTAASWTGGSGFPKWPRYYPKFPAGPLIKIEVQPPLPLHAVFIYKKFKRNACGTGGFLRHQLFFGNVPGDHPRLVARISSFVRIGRLTRSFNDLRSFGLKPSVLPSFSVIFGIGPCMLNDLTEFLKLNPLDLLLRLKLISF